MSWPEEDWLQLSGLQHFAFCRRQWALIHIEDQWAENYRTVDGHLMHERVHDQTFRESRWNCLTVRGLAIHSAELGISGQCNAVEFHRDTNGVPLRGREGVGLDSYVGFLHRDRPGRTSLALDLMEELRPCMADRFVLTLINNRQVKAADFQYMESGAVLLTDSGRKTFLKHWQEKKKETLTHPYLGEKLPWGMIPYIQALLLARYLRGDLDAYPPFLWK